MGKHAIKSLRPRELQGLARRVFLSNLRLLVLLLLVPVCLTSLTAYYCYSYAVQRELDDSGEHLAQSAAEQLEQQLYAQLTFEQGLYSLSDVEKFLIFPENGGVLHYDFGTIMDTLELQIFQNEAVRDVAIYSILNDSVLCAEGLVTNGRYFDSGWLDDIAAHETGASVWVRVRTAVGKTLKPYKAVTVYHRLVHENGWVVGYVGVSLDAVKLRSNVELTLADYDKAVYVTLSDGTVLTLAGHTEQTENCKLYTSPVSGTDWTVTAAVQRGGNVSIRSTMQVGLTLLVLGCFVLTGLLAVVFYRKVIQPYNAVAELLSAPVEGEQAVQDTGSSVTDAVRNLLERNAAVSRELGDRAKDLRHMQSLALQAQINPHMLYNSLDSINWTVMELSGVENDASTMLTLLGSVLRYAADGSTLTVTLFTELEHVQEYVVLQQLRYQNSFDFRLDADESVLQYNVIRLIIQPILENAIEHGIKSLKTRGLVTVQVHDEGTLIRILITDNGPGMDEAHLQAVREHIQNGGGTGRGKNIGMYNVHRRIQLYYGDEYGLTLDSAPGGGTCVTITFPKE